jgi:predicted ATP-dependent endonuclease of OLD family
MLKSLTIKKDSTYFYVINGCEEVNFDFSEPDGENRGSGLNIFVGKNGAGKSEFIKCITNKAVGSSHFFLDGFLEFNFSETTKVVSGPNLRSKKRRSGGRKEIDPIPNGTYDYPDRVRKEHQTVLKNVEYTINGFGMQLCLPGSLSSGEEQQGKFADFMGEAEEDTIYIFDEPESYLSPHVQRVIYEEILELSKTNQVIVATHSPFFIDWGSILYGATVFRFSLENDLRKVIISAISSDHIKKFGFFANFQTCYKSGIESREFFFLDDVVILVEGQDDVFFYKILFNKAGIPSNKINFFGYGLSGFSEIPKMVSLLSTLNYKKVIILVDKFSDNKNKLIFDALNKAYNNVYKFFEIPAADIRDKSEKGIVGMCEKNGKSYDVKSEYKEDWGKIIKEILNYI